MKTDLFMKTTGDLQALLYADVKNIMSTIDIHKNEIRFVKILILLIPAELNRFDKNSCSYV